MNVSDLMGIETEAQDEAINTEQSTEGWGSSYIMITASVYIMNSVSSQG